MISRFSLYDFIAIVVPGIFFLWSLGIWVDSPFLQRIFPISGELAETSVLIVVGYVTGLLIHALSHHVVEKILLRLWGGFPSARWLLPTDSHFSEDYRRELSAAVLRKFDVILKTDPEEPQPRSALLKRNQEIFYRCYRSVEKLSEVPATFNAQYGLFRSLLACFVLLDLAAMWRVLSTYSVQRLVASDAVLLAGIAVVGTILSYLRVVKRSEDFARSVFDIFLANPEEATEGRSEGT